MSEKNKITCKKCGGLDHWLPRMPGVTEDDLDQWRCWTCKPTRNYSIIAKRIGPLADAIRERHAAREATLSAEAAGEQIEAFTAWVCPSCKCHWVKVDQVSGDRKCFVCNIKLTSDVILTATRREKQQAKRFKRFDFSSEGK